MNVESLNEYLAIEVMGYQKTFLAGMSPDEWGYKRENLPIQMHYDWLSTENIEQAVMCLGTFKRVSIAKNEKQGWCCSVRDGGWEKWHNSGWHESLSMAISLACAKATGWKDDS